MADRNGKKAIPIGTIPRLEKPNWREDYVIRVLPSLSKRYPEPVVELKVYVDNRTTEPHYLGLSSRGGYFAFTAEQFNALVDMAPKVREALKALESEEGEAPATGDVPSAPSFELLSEITKPK